MKPILLSAFLLLVSGCISTPTPPVQQNMGAVAIDVDLRLKGSLLNMFPGFVDPTAVFFARLDESGNVHSSNEIYASNYFIGDTAYLLNAKPGTYVAIGFRAYKEKKNDSQYIKDGYIIFDVLVPEKMIKLTRVKVCAGQVSYMGEFHMVEPKFEERAKIVDRSQQHYYGKMIEVAYGDAYGKNYFKDKTFDLRNRTKISSDINPTFGALLEYHYNDETRVKKHLKKAHNAMQKSQWTTFFQKSLNGKVCQ